MSLTVDIANVEVTDNTLEVAVFVTTDTTKTIDYALNINDTATGGIVTRRGTLVGGAGSYPGDTQTERVSFGVNQSTGGTVTATITEPEEYVGAQDQVKWGDQDATTQFDINQCASNPTSSGDLEVDYSVSPSGASGGDATVEVRVDGQVVGQATHFVPVRGGGFSQTIPASQLPIGEDMPVEVGINGDFRDCGTVSVADPDAAPEPTPEPEPSDPSISLTCTGLSTSQITSGGEVGASYSVTNSGGRLAVVDIGVFVNGSQVGTEFETLSAGETAEGTVDIALSEPGDYTVNLEVVKVES